TTATMFHFYAYLGDRRDHAFRALVTGVLAFLEVVNQWAPLRGTVIELKTIHLPGGGTSLLTIRTPPGAPLVLNYLTVLVVNGYGFFVARTIWKRDRAGGVLVAAGLVVCLSTIIIGLLADFAKVRVPYAGALASAVFVVCVALFLSREYAVRGARVV